MIVGKLPLTPKFDTVLKIKDMTKTTLNHETPDIGTKPVLGDALSQLVIKIDKLIKDEEQYNPEQLNESSWNYQVGILITANEAKLLLKMLDKANALLISKSPQMLEMLEKVHELFDMLRFPTESEINEYKSEIKALINEATEI